MNTESNSTAADLSAFLQLDARSADSKSTANKNLVVLNNFFSPEGRVALAEEVAGLVTKALPMANEHTVFGRPGGESSLPRDRKVTTFCSVLGAEKLEHKTLVRRIYHSRMFQRAVAQAIGVEEIFESSDPIRATGVNLLKDGGCLGWHFDAHEVTVSTVTLSPTAGGDFEYACNSRAKFESDDPVAHKILDADPEHVRSIRVPPGDVQIFFGRNTVHRVTPVRDSRHSVTWCYRLAPEEGTTQREANGLYPTTKG